LLLLQDSQEVEDSARLRSVLGSSSSNGSGASSSACGRPKPQYGRLPAHSRMLETWILCELCNAGNMQDAVMLREHSVFFEGETPQMVRTAGTVRVKAACSNHVKRIRQGFALQPYRLSLWERAVQTC
jgi:hypothetical protein